MHAGDRVVLPFVTANRDKDEFRDPDSFVIDREGNRHLGFGVGPHRCAGSHLARVELAVALEEWHRRIPDYRLAADHDPGYLVTQTLMRPRSVRLEWDR